MINVLKRKEVYPIQEYLKHERITEKDINNKYFKVASTTLALILYSEKVMAATNNATALDPGFWKLVGIIQKIVAGLALLYSYRILAKMAAKGEGTWKEVGYGLLIAAADYGLPTAFKFVSGLF